VCDPVDVPDPSPAPFGLARIHSTTIAQYKATRSMSAWKLKVARCRTACYLTSVSILNIGMYIEMMMMPTMTPTPIIMIGSTIDVSDCTDASTSSS
jgi:hypothetical protein